MPIARAYLVESIPTGMEGLGSLESVEYTHVVLKRLTEQAQRCIDLTAMYWNLVPDVGRVDEEGFSDEQFAALGAKHGQDLHRALANAAGRGVKIRILQSPGFNGDGPQESDKLAEQYPDQIQVRQLHMPEWFDGGIMHQKMWVIDGQHLYIGSANMDWKSLSQVKELGVVVENHEDIATDARKQFEVWWRLGSLPPSITKVWDPLSQISRTVPSWSPLALNEARKPSPMDLPELGTAYNMEGPMPVVLNGKSGDLFITSSPPEICAPDRTPDLDGLLHTIQTAGSSICISVMDFAPTSMHRGKYDRESGKLLVEGEVAKPVWWSQLMDALLQASITKGIHVRLLVSHWAYTSPVIAPYLKAMQDLADACHCSQRTSCGKLEIKRFIVPGWDDVSGPDRQYPGHTRVNHPKYVVTDQRLNIGTSNLTWDYFANSAGCSFNSNHPDLLHKLQELFDRDWSSPYAHVVGSEVT